MSLDMEEIKGFKRPVFCTQSFATGNRRFQAGEVYDAEDPVVSNDAHAAFFSRDIPKRIGAPVAGGVV